MYTKHVMKLPNNLFHNKNKFHDENVVGFVNNHNTGVPIYFPHATLDC